MKLAPFLLIAILAHTVATAQPCKYFPADCPVNGVEDFGTADDSTERMNNPVIPQEIVMENRLRRFTTSLMQRIAGKEGWQVYQLSETASSGFRAPDQSVLAYDLRPPHWLYITFEFIVNTDSLEAWKTWLTNFSRQQLDALNQYSARATTAYDRAKPYTDSAQYYGQLMGQYMTDHMAQYQKDLLAGNKTGTNAYEKAVAAYQKRSDYFTQKAAAVQKDPANETSSANADSERTRQTLYFREATLLIVEIGFNMDYAKTAGILQIPKTAGIPQTPKTASTLQTPGATQTPNATQAAIWFTNPNPDPNTTDPFNRSRNSALLLEGDWNKKPDSYGGYRPSFESIKSGIDHTTPKRLKCDQVQTIDIHVSGNKQAIRRLLTDLPRAEITALIIH